MIGVGDEEEVRFDWRRGGAAVAGLLAALALLAMIFLVKFANDSRERALAAERHTYEVALVVRNVSANVSRSEAALARFVLDEDVKGSGNIYASDWQLAGFQIDQLSNLMRTSPEQLRRVAELRQLYRKRGEELSLAARAALQKQGDAGISYFYQAATQGSGRRLDDKLEEIIRAERSSLRSRIEASQFFSEQASRRSDYLSWIGFIVGLGAIFLGVVSVQALRQNAAARRQIESEAERSEALEQAVRQRTQELWEANQALKAEAAEREAAEAQLRQVQKMEAVGQLTGGIAHDFNNMLAVVVGGIDLALRRLNGPRREVMMHLNNAMEGATRAAALTRRLLSFARSEPLLPERVDSNELIGGMSDLLDRTLGERIRIEVDRAPETWPTYVDPHQLENAILNLAVNARDAMDGQGSMRIATENVKLAANAVGDIRAGDYVKISVTDTGCGMPPDVLERAFEPFFTTKPVGKGTGLGLSQIFGFAHQSGGEVGIDSQVGRGTSVAIYLPRTEVAAPLRIHPATSAQRADTDARVPGARILLVEDDPRVCAATVDALEDLDYDPIACSSGADAIRVFQEQVFDLVITDVIMPEMTGPELIRYLKRTSPHDFAVLFVTGYVGEGESDDLRGHELLRKPFTVGALASAVSAALARTASEPPRTSAAGGAG
ncbi:CHASE3 domain-containing protein [Sphingomonas limnosediminicola]|jgi:signal transduction histidine kinase/ActR/RegA family two-component response regulator|uniref:histidine kinase n=1 Tax=Sphingomonas limnosediminicola TaxID=940133 RepID=A0ABP7LBK3_9SPHN